MNIHNEQVRDAWGAASSFVDHRLNRRRVMVQKSLAAGRRDALGDEFPFFFELGCQPRIDPPGQITTEHKT
jgi:hypothetical protein